MAIPAYVNLEIIYHRYERGNVTSMFVVAASIGNKHDGVLVRLSQIIIKGATKEVIKRSWTCNDFDDYKIFDYTEDELEEMILDACVGLDDNFGKDPGPQKKEIRF